MYNTRRKLFVCLTVVITVFLSMYAGALDTQAAETKVFKLSNNEAEAITVTAHDHDVVFENFPTDGSFNYINIHLQDEVGNSFNEIWTKTEDNKVSYSLSGVPDGDYYIQLYISAEEYGTYWSYIYGAKLRIRIENGQAGFVTSAVYENNQNIYNSKRTDKAALDYYLEQSDDIMGTDNGIAALAAEITVGIANDYEKVKAVHDWVCENIWYDYDVYYGFTDYGDASALSTLESRRGVCAGYASLTAALLRASGIPAKIVTGYALGIGTNGYWNDSTVNETVGNHAWNEAFADGRWIILDTTWDSGNKYENGTKTDNTGLRSHLYFDTSLEMLSNSHKIFDYNEEDIPDIMAIPTGASVLVNGKPVEFDSYNIYDNNYFKLRDIAYVLNETGKQFSVSWDEVNNAILLFSGEPYTEIGGEMSGRSGEERAAVLTKSKIFLDGTEIKLTAYNINGNNYFKLRDIGQALDFGVDWDSVNNNILVHTAKGYTAA